MLEHWAKVAVGFGGGIPAAQAQDGRFTWEVSDMAEAETGRQRPHQPLAEGPGRGRTGASLLGAAGWAPAEALGNGGRVARTG